MNFISLPMVAASFPKNSSSQKRNKIEVFPEPESPINNNFNDKVSWSVENDICLESLVCLCGCFPQGVKDN